MIDTEALRKKVIDLAIQGKLTEQLPSDGDAETIYAQILDHKSQLIKEGKVKKDKALPDIAADEIPFEIPDNWKWVRLYEISDTNIGLTYHPENIVDEGTVVLRSNNIQNGVFDYSDLVHVNCEVRENQYIRKNDILICSRNGSKNLVGKCAIYDGELGDVSFGAFMAILRTSLFKYVYYYLTTDAFRRYFSNDDTKQINQVTQDILKKAIVPLPPLKEQERIIAKLENVLDEIDIIDDLQAKYSNDLAVLKSKIIDAGIQGKLTEQLPEDGDAEELYSQIQEEKEKLVKESKVRKEKPLPEITEDEIPFEIPKNWKWVRLANLSENTNASMADGPFGSNLKREHYTDAKQVRIIQLSNIGDGGWKNDNEKYTSFDHLELIKRSKVEPGNIVIAKMMPAGRAIIVPEVSKMFVLSSDCVKFVPHQLLNTKFLNYAINSSVFREQVVKNITGVGRERTSLKKLKNCLVALPPINEQKRVVETIESLLRVLAKY